MSSPPVPADASAVVGRRIAIRLAYEGTRYSGWQVQPNQATVQGTLAAAIREVSGEELVLKGASRTDAGVHAFGQVVAEAKMAGRAVLVADVDGLPEQIGKAGVIADCSSAQTLALALAALPAQPLMDMGVAGHRAMLTAERERIDAWRALFLRQLAPAVA
jgi:phage gpG-like protein